MSGITAAEKKLLKFIDSEDLRLSAESIRRVIAKLWSNEAPRIVKDFTDHGIGHSERLANLVVKLIDANDGRHLSSKEIYILLVGIYLHDIGMQCDIVKFPEIKKFAEQFGAKLNYKFDSKTSSGYGLEEQKYIRINHQFLSAAWIHYSYLTGDTVLGAAIKTIPGKLISDVIDVCKYHSGLPITDCLKNLNLTLWDASSL
jgi:hypothetical protein